MSNYEEKNRNSRPTENLDTQKPCTNNLVDKPSWRPAEICHLAINAVTMLAIIYAAYVYNGQLNQMIISTEATQSAAKAAQESIEQSKDFFHATTESSRLDQRAWVGVVNVLRLTKDTDDEKKFIKEGEYFQTGLLYTNSGKTPALNVKSIVSIRMRHKHFEFVPTHKNIEPESIGFIQPGAQAAAIFPKGSDKTRKDTIQSFENGLNIIYLYATIEYEDIFGALHRTKYCGFLASNLDKFSACPTYNDAD